MVDPPRIVMASARESLSSSSLEDSSSEELSEGRSSYGSDSDFEPLADMPPIDSFPSCFVGADICDGQKVYEGLTGKFLGDFRSQLLSQRES